MGVYIKGIEMPKSCQSCFANEYQTCIFADKNASVNGKLPDCPLVPVPPHGRLGDLDAAVELAIQYCPDDDGSCSKADSDLRELLDEIESLPTIIPAEEGET